MHPVLQTLIRWGNPFMKALLRSPLHGLVSHSYLIIGVTGRKSGRLYETPVQYQQVGETLWIITSAAYVWWRNLIGAAPVTVIVTLRGQPHTGTAAVHTDAATIQTALHTIYPGLSPQQIGVFTPGKVALEIMLQEGEDRDRRKDFA